jgi:ketosteroid isomerase-like protein
LTLQGKGFYIWQIKRCEGGSADAIADAAVQAGLSHVLIKIADGTNSYNIDLASGVDLVPAVKQALKVRNIQVWGWQYVYGYDPIGEANIAIQRIQQLDLDGYAIDAESQYAQPGRDVAASQFMTRLRTVLPDFPVALSSYRYPTYHPQLPWQAFLEKCDINMPQVYWVESHNPGEQLARSLREFQTITPFKPLIPTGSAYKQGSWEPSSAEIIEFLQTARNLNMSAANFWEWGHTRLYLPGLWDTIATYSWPVTPDQQDVLQRYFTALNAHDLNQVMALYDSNAVHVDATSTIQGNTAIRAWYSYVINQILPNATFTLGENSSNASSRYFSWTAISTSGNVTDGNDSIGIVAGKIVYHFTQFSVTPP